MERSYHGRWRHTRDTIPARRRRRRTHRRDHKRGGTYYPMAVDPKSAMRGVRARLLGAVVTASTTLICVLYATLSSLDSFGATFALAVGMCSFGAAVALLLSARHEEKLHELAAGFGYLKDGAGRADDAAGVDSQSNQPKALPEPNSWGRATVFNRPERTAVGQPRPSEMSDRPM